MNLFNVSFKPALLFLTLIPIAALANNNQSLPSSNQYAVGFNLGMAKPTNLGNAATFPLGYSTFSYSANTHSEHAFISGISLSKILPINSLYTSQVGVSANYLSSMNVKGDLAQGIAPPYYQSTYSYSVNSYQFLIDAKLRREFCHGCFPYIYLGLGVASNRAHDYSAAVPGYLTVTPNYSNETTNSFTYSLGLGMDYFATSNISIGLGYRFINLGKTGLGSGVIRNTHVGAKLTQSNLYLNTLLAQINYFL